MKAILLLFFVNLYLDVLAQSMPNRPITNLYIEWQHLDSTITLGHFGPNRLKRIPTFNSHIAQLSQQDIENWLSNTGTDALLFFHCMWGQQPQFHKRKYLASFDKILDAGQGDNNGTEISVIWHAGGINYLENYREAAFKGETLGNAVYWITQHFSGKTNVLCHSMGNRFFEGVLRTMPLSYKPFQNIIFFSADLDNDTNSEDFTNCLHAASNLYVYIHRNDKFLLVSSLLHGNKRLGKAGPSTPKPNLYVIDMTDYIIGVQNHTHIDKPWVQQQIRENLL